MSFFISLYLEVDILHASFWAPCNRLYFISWFSWDRDPSHRAESGPARRPGPGQSAWLWPPASVPFQAYQRFQIHTVSGKCLISPYHFCPRFIHINPQWVLAYPDSDKYVQTDRQRQLLNESTPEHSIQKSRKKISICQSTCKACVLCFTIVLNFASWSSRNWGWIVFTSLGHSVEGLVTYEDHLVLCVSVWSPFKKNTQKSIFILILLQSDSAASSISRPSHFIFRVFTWG